MRTFLALGFFISLLGASAIGAVYAFTTSVSSGSSTVAVGTADLAILYFPDSTLLGPNDDIPVKVGDGVVDVLGSFTLSLSGSVTIDAVNDLPPGDASCLETHFEGSVDGLAASMTPEEAATPFDVLVATRVEAVEACQGDEVSYTVTITGTT